MKEALKNFALVTMGIVLCLFAAWIYLRGKGLSEPIKPPLKHAFLESPVSVIAYRGDDSTDGITPLEALDKAAALGPDIVLWVDLGPDAGGKLVVFDRMRNPTPTTLADALERFPQHRMILNFRHNRPGMVADAIGVIDSSRAGERVLIQSPEEGFLREVREQRPLWLYGSSQARAVQMKMLASFGLEAMAPLKGDVFVIDWADERAGLRGLSKAVIEEVHRREMKIFAGPVETAAEASTLRDQGVDGVLTTRPSTFVEPGHR